MVAENKEVHRTVINTDEILNQQFYENKNSRTTSSWDSFTSDMIYLNFKAKSTNYLQAVSVKDNKNLSNQINLKKLELPVYFSDNKSKLNNLFENIILKKDFTDIKVRKVEKNYFLLRDNISELKFGDIHLEITNDEIIKFTALFDDNKILMISKDVSDNDANIIYSYFINRQLIASDVADISTFTKKFSEYRCL